MNLNRLAILWAAVGLNPCSPAAAAATDTVTIKASVSPIFRQGELQGCTVVFDAGRYDPEYYRNELVYLSGSLAFYAFPNKMPVFVLKLGVRPISSSSTDYIAPAELFLLDNLSTNKVDFLSTSPSETAGFGLFAFKADETTVKMTLHMVETGKLRMGYAMRSGGMLAPFDIDVTMKALNFDAPANSQRVTAAPREWSDCMIGALDLAKSRMERQ